MSLLNDMLHDLERRSAEEEPALADVYPLFIDRPVPVESMATRKTPVEMWRSLLLAGAIFGLLAFELSTGFLPESDEVRILSGGMTEVIADSSLNAQQATPEKLRPKMLPWSDVAESRFALLRRVVQVRENQSQIREDLILAETTGNELLAEKDITKPSQERQQPRSSLDTEQTYAESSAVPGDEPVVVVAKVNEDPGEREATDLHAAKLLVFRGKREPAKQKLMDLLAVFPESIIARRVLAGWHAQDKDWELVASLLTEVDTASDPGLKMLKARMLFQRGSEEQAVSLLDSNTPAVALNLDYFALLAALLQRGGRYSEAVPVYRQLTESIEPRGDWWGGLGVSLDQSGQKKAALLAYQQALRFPDTPASMRRYARERIASLDRWED